MNTFTKIGNDWCIRVFPGNANPGDTVTVAKRDGSTQQVTLGALVRSDNYGRVYAAAPRPQAQAPAAQAVGSLTGITAMFDHAKRHLKFPAFILDGFRVSVAGTRAAHPGTLNVTGIDKVFNQRRGTMERPWFGRVSLDGTFQPARSAPADLADKLRKFAADPAGEAAAFGKLTGRCCFCRKALGEGEDRRSVEVGYGPDCADHFGLPWGERQPTPLAAIDAMQAHDAATPRLGSARGTARSRARAQAAAYNPEARMQRMEAEGDRAETARDEAAKHEARRAMESGYEGDVDGQAARREEQPRQHLPRAEQYAHFESATDGSYDGTEDYENVARRERAQDNWRNRSRRRDYA